MALPPVTLYSVSTTQSSQAFVKQPGAGRNSAEASSTPSVVQRWVLDQGPWMLLSFLLDPLQARHQTAALRVAAIRRLIGHSPCPAAGFNVELRPSICLMNTDAGGHSSASSTQ